MAITGDSTHVRENLDWLPKGVDAAHVEAVKRQLADFERFKAAEKKRDEILFMVDAVVRYFGLA